MSKPTRFFPAIQYLRGFAAVYVVLFHLNTDGQWPAFVNGGFGVQLFFMISGFLITTIHGADQGWAAVRRFLYKRFVRIYPAYWVTLLPVIWLFYAWPAKGLAWHRDPWNIIRNWLLIHDPNQSILSVSWTLVYEIMFYLLFGALIIGLRQRLVWVLAIWLGLILGNQFVWHLSGSRWLVLHFLNVYFILGCYLALWQRRASYPVIGCWVWAALMAFVLCPFLIVSEYALLVTCFGLCATAVFYQPGNQPSAALLWLGDASYSIYLTHVPLIAIVTTFAKDPRLFLPLLGLCIGVGLLFHRLVERPLLTLGKHRALLDWRVTTA